MNTSHVEMLRLLGKACLDNDELKREIKALQSNIRKKDVTLEELETELFVSKESHRALISAITTLKSVRDFSSIEWCFSVDKTYVILDGQFTLYEVQK